MPRVAFILCLFDLAAALLVAALLFGSGSDPATRGLDVAAGGAVVLIAALTALPSLVLLRGDRARRAALALAAAFPLLCLLLLLVALAALP